TEIGTAREAERRARVERLVAPLVARVSSTAHGLTAIAAQFAFRTPATLVFNPGPFTRSDVAVLPDGTERVVTDVPGCGYLCAQPVAGEPGRWTRGGDELVV